MLTIKTSVKPSKISGLGIYTEEFIPKGKIVWEYFPLIDITYSNEKWKELKQNLAPESFSQIKKYSYKENGKYIVCMDNAQFMNHSVDKANIENTDDLKSMFAKRDIQAGEELLCNYFDYSDEDDHHVTKLKNIRN